MTKAGPNSGHAEIKSVWRATKTELVLVRYRRHRRRVSSRACRTMDLRRRGRRAAPPPAARGARGGNETFLNRKQMMALHHTFTSSPVMAAVRQVLHGELLRGGICVQRDGHEVELTPAFRKHLNTRWAKFAADVVDSFLTFGIAVVAFDEDKDLARQRRRLPGASTEPLLAPLVPPLECVDVAVAPAGRLGYAREYSVYTRSATHHARRDHDARVHVRDKPDAGGNLVSPMSACFDYISFVDCLQELALAAEVTNSRVHVFTQQVRASGTEAASPFAFDTLSREVATDLDTEANVAAAEALSRQLQLTRLLNRLQTTRQSEPALHVVAHVAKMRGEAERVRDGAHAERRRGVELIPQVPIRPALGRRRWLPRAEVGDARGCAVDGDARRAAAHHHLPKVWYAPRPQLPCRRAVQPAAVAVGGAAREHDVGLERIRVQDARRAARRARGRGIAQQVAQQDARPRGRRALDDAPQRGARRARARSCAVGPPARRTGARPSRALRRVPSIV